MEFNSEKELRERLSCALSTKISELESKGINYITEDEIWQYLINTKWKNAHGLCLSDMVDDILKIEIK